MQNDKLIEALADALANSFRKSPRIEDAAAAVLELVTPERLVWEEDPRAGWKRGRIVGITHTHKTVATIFRVDGGWQYMGDVYLTAHDSLDEALERAKAAAQSRADAAHWANTPLNNLVGLV